MSSLYIDLGGESPYLTPSVATVGALPANATLGSIALVQSNGQIYWWNGTSWVSSDPTGPIQSVANTNSINLSDAGSVLTANLNLSGASADAGNFLPTVSIKSDGLFIEIPVATSSQTGVLSSSDWTTFNGKQAAGNYITALTGDVTATGPGSVAATLAKIQGTAVTGTTGTGNVVFSASPTLSGTTTHTGNIAMSGNKVTGLGAPTTNGDALRYDQLGAASGIATLDPSGKVYLAQLPASVFLYQGSWNPNTNTPTLVDGTGTSGYVYYVSAARSSAVSGLNNASMTNFQIGDLVIYNGTQWELTTPAAGVQSVNGAQGVVTVEPTIAAGTTSQYWRGDKTFQTLNTDALVPFAGGTHTAGLIGALISSSVTAATTTGVAATGTYGNVTSISLPAGQYLLTGVAGFSQNGANLTTSLSCGFSSSTDGSALGTLDPATYNALISSTSDLVAPVPTLIVAPTTTTTYYLNTRFYYTSGTPQHYGRIIATRIT